MKNYWLMKSEPGTFSIGDLEARPGQTEGWDGVRNYQARNFMRDDMRVGDLVLFYHSNCPEPGVVGLAEVASEPYPDPTAFDPDSAYYDPKFTSDKPRWFQVDVRFVRKFPRTVSLREMKADEALAGMRILRKGNRLSITPVEKAEFDHIVGMAG
jgi:predicted RNA-binding protein with PUA-like domain